MKATIVNLNIFDYIRSSTDHPLRSLKPLVAFAGNLEKSTFLHRELSAFEFNILLYGINYDEQNITSLNVEYKGAFLPNEIPSKLEGSFGLVWDGDSTDGCNGTSGDYIRYNNPHKLSLYISSCLPVIVWSQAAIADFVRQHNIGFCVDKLSDIRTKINDMDEDEYQSYLTNVRKMQEKIVSGYFTRKAMGKALTIIINNEI